MIELGKHTDVDLYHIEDIGSLDLTVDSMKDAHLEMIRWDASMKDLEIDEDSVQHDVWAYRMINIGWIEVDGRAYPDMAMKKVDPLVEAPDGYRIETKVKAKEL